MHGQEAGLGIPLIRLLLYFSVDFGISSSARYVLEWEGGVLSGILSCIPYGCRCKKEIFEGLVQLTEKEPLYRNVWWSNRRIVLVLLV